MNTDFYQMGAQSEGSPYIVQKLLGINMIDDIGVGVLIVDFEGRISTANQALLTMLGYSELEIRNLDFDRLVDSMETGTGIFKISAMSARDILGKGERFQTEKRFIRRDGRTFWVRLTISPVANEARPSADSSDDYFVVTVEDISINKQADELLKSQKLESMGVLVNGIAHDFNNILAGILANVQLAKLSYQKGKDVTKSLAGAEEAVKRAVDLTKQLLAFSKGGSPIKEVAFIANIVKDTVEITLRGSNVECGLTLPENLWRLEVDPEQISQMFQQLIRNAVQAMPQGGIIKVSAENIQIKSGEVPPLKPGAYIKIVIRDTGVGIPEADLGKIFDPYFTTKKGSCGLGLTNSYSIVKRHDGYMNVSSMVGIGTTFEIYLPTILNQTDAVTEGNYKAEAVG